MHAVKIVKHLCYDTMHTSLTAAWSLNCAIQRFCPDQSQKIAEFGWGAQMQVSTGKACLQRQESILSSSAYFFGVFVCRLDRPSDMMVLTLS